jgi:hypothetical protein
VGLATLVATWEQVGCFMSKEITRHFEGNVKHVLYFAISSWQTPATRGTRLKASGQVICGSSDCQNFLHAFVWEEGGPMLD